MDPSRREEMLARYKLRSQVFDEVAKRRRGNDRPSDPSAHAAEVCRAPLTARDLKVLALVAAGMTDSEIAARLSVSAYTVKERIKRLLANLDARNRAQAVAIGLRRGLIRYDRPTVGQ